MAVFLTQLRFETYKKNYKALSGSSPIFAISNYTTFGRTQTNATVP
jgi:hypothetical protein